MVKILDVDTL